MTRLEIQAIRALPRRFVRDGTHVATVNNHVVALNGSAPLAPIIWDKRRWKKLSIAQQLKP